MAADEPASDRGVEVLFSELNALLRLAGLYPVGHPHIQRAQQLFFEGVTAYVERHRGLEYRFLGDLLIAENRILPRESLMYRRLLEVCQVERRIGGITFRQGVTMAEVEALVEILTGGSGDDVARWAQRRGVTHIALEPPAKQEDQTSEVMARRAYFGAVEMLRTVEAGILESREVSVEQLSSLRVLSSAILDQILADPSLVLRLANIKSHDEYTLYHSVNVCVLSIGIGALLNLPDADLRELGVGAILHDLGKITIPRPILQRPGPLSEAELELMRHYPARGAEMLSRLPGFNRIPMVVCFEHRIRPDRRGYPEVPAGWTPHPFSQIVGLTDAYDSLTTMRPNVRPLSAVRALATLREEGDGIYDPRLVRVLDRLVRSPAG